MHALQKYGLFGKTGGQAVVAISDQIVDAENPKAFAEQVIHELTGEKFVAQHTVQARMMAKYVVKAIVDKAPIDFAEFNTKIISFVEKNKWILVEPKPTYVPVAQQIVLGKTSAKTAKGKERGKKGEKQRRAIELFKKNPTMSGADLTKLFVKELGMTTTGARTYAYNVRKVWA
jgi:hypothetical protein